MKKQIGIAALLLVPLGVSFAFQQDKDKKPVAAGASKDDPMMAKMKEFGAPAAEHKVLASKVGKWSGKQKCWMDPAAPPMESTATSEMKWVFGERYIQDTYKGTFNGEPFEGQSVTGFDKGKKKYVTSWISNMGTAIDTFEGTYDPATKTFTYTGQCFDPMQNKIVAHRMVEKVEPDHINMQMFYVGADGKEAKGMELDLTRAK